MKELVLYKYIHKRSWLFFWLAYASFSVLNSLCSQYNMYPFEHYNERNGLPASTRKIIQDSFGFIWIASTDGLTRYDAKTFKVYRNKLGDSLTIPNNIINDLSLDKTGNIWVATNGGLCYYNYQDDKFHQIQISESLERTDRYRVHCLTLDRYGLIWFATKTAVHHLNEKNQIEYSYFLPFRNKLIIKSIYINSNEQLFIGTNQSELLMVDLCSNRKYSTLLLSSDARESTTQTTVRIIIPYKKDTLIIGSWLGGLNKVYFFNEKLNVIHYENKIEKELQKNIITGVGIQNDSLWWIGTFGTGIGLFNPQKRTFLRMIKYLSSNPYSLSNDYINEIFVDRVGSIWISTEEGVNRYDKLKHQFNTLTIPTQQTEHSVYRKPSCIIEDNKDPNHQWMWISIAGIGLLKYHRTTHEFKNVVPILSQNKTGNKNLIYQLMYNANNQLIVLLSSGLYYMDEKSYKFTPIHLPNTCTIENPRKIIQDRSGNYWVTSLNNGLFFISAKLDVCKHYLFNPEDIQSIRDNIIFCLMEDFQGNIWIGTQNSGLSILHVKENRFTHFEHNKSNPRTIPDNNIYEIYEDPQHFIWIATENGLARMDSETRALKIFTTAEGLANNDIFTITPDIQNKLWLSTNNGISVLNTSDGTIQNYSQLDGLGSNRMDGSSVSTMDGYLYFSSNGMISFCKPDHFLKNQIAPTAMITSIKIYGQEIPLLREAGKLKEIHLYYQKNIFNPEFSALNYTNSSENKYAYIVEGYDPAWIYSGNISTTTYTNLPGGKYIFKIKASNNEGIWSDTGDEVKLIVHPPFWETWWFYLLVPVVFISALYFYYRIRISQVIKLQQLRMSIARDLHDEVGSTLSSINLTSNMVERNAEHSEYESQLFNRIQLASKKAMEMMNEIVWSIQPENDQLDMLFSRMRQYTSEILEASDIPFEFEVNENPLQLVIPFDKRKEILMIFKEAINNLAKYSRASAAKIKLEVSKQSFWMVIEDNGIGIDLSKVHYGNGIKNMKERADVLKADFNFDSAPGQGTKIELKVNILP